MKNNFVKGNKVKVIDTTGSFKYVKDVIRVGNIGTIVGDTDDNTISVYFEDLDCTLFATKSEVELV